MRSIERLSHAIPVPTTRTTGLFHVPRLASAHHLELRVYLSNFDRQTASADITVNQAYKGRKNVLFRTNLLVPAMGAVVQTHDAIDMEGTIIEAEVVLSTNLVKPSLAIVQGSNEENSEQTVLFLPPSAFSLLRAFDNGRR